MSESTKNPRPGSKQWHAKAALLAFEYAPPIFACLDCGQPCADGYCCPDCGSGEGSVPVGNWSRDHA